MIFFEKMHLLYIIFLLPLRPNED